MFVKFINKTCYSNREFIHFASAKNLILIQVILLVLSFQGCAFLRSRQKAKKYFSQTDIENIIENIKKQEDIVSEFYSTGTLAIKGRIIDRSLGINIIGKRYPLMFKIETSYWSKPALYFLIKEDKLEIRDYKEKKHYIGKFTAENLSKFLPNMDFPPEIIWPLLRGCPHFISYSHVYEGAAGVLYIEDPQKNRVGTITFSPGDGIKEAVSSPPRFHSIKFTDFRKTGDIEYAEKTVVENIKDRKNLTLKRNKVVGKDIPDAIFTLKNRPVYEVVNLDDL